MAKSLLKFETIDAKDIKKIIDGKKIIRRPNRKNLKNGRTKLKAKTSREKSKPLKSNGRL